jgi:hypothetical protein
LEDLVKKLAVLSLVIAVLCCCPPVFSQSADPASASELAAISARGRALAEYDAAAWHSSDAVLALNPTKDTVQLYVARKTESGWIAMWGRFNEDKTKFLIAYEAREGTSPTEYKVVQHAPPIEDSDWYLRAAKAHELARADFLNGPHEQRSYNESVLPSATGDWIIYFLPAQTENEVLPLGGDVRYGVAADGEAITEKRQMHKTILEETLDKPLRGMHTHILSDVPEDSDVFYAMTLNAMQGDWIVTKNYTYKIGADGSVGYLGKTDEVTESFRDGKPETIPDPDRSMELAIMKRAIEGTPPPEGIESFVSLASARCKGEQLWLKFSIVVHNSSESRVILHPRWDWNAQIRFAATEKDMLADKYEKILNFVPDKIDYSDEKAFLQLGPGMTRDMEMEYPTANVDLKGKSAVQFLFLAWPPMEKDQADEQRTHWAKIGDLYTEDIETPPAPLKLDPALVAGCPAK